MPLALTIAIISVVVNTGLGLSCAFILVGLKGLTPGIVMWLASFQRTRTRASDPSLVNVDEFLKDPENFLKEK